MSKQLTESDVSDRLVVNKKWWKMIKPLFDGPDSAVCVVDGATGMFWEFRCTVRRKGPYDKPVFQSEGWLRFVNYKGLMVGDHIFLEPAEDEFRGTRFVITARRFAADGNWIDL